MMAMSSDQERVRDLLTEAVMVLCKNGLSFDSEMCVEGLLGITLDKQNVFLVSIRETVSKAVDSKSSEDENSDTASNSQQDKIIPLDPSRKHEKRRRKRASTPTKIPQGDSSVYYSSDADEEPWEKRQNIKDEIEQDSQQMTNENISLKPEEESDDLVFVKQEALDESSQGSSLPAVQSHRTFYNPAGDAPLILGYSGWPVDDGPLVNHSSAATHIQGTSAQHTLHSSSGNVQCRWCKEKDDLIIQLQIAKLESDEAHPTDVRPKPGFYGANFAAANRMVELVPGSRLYLYSDERDAALRAANKINKQGVRITSGPAVVKHLMSVFWTKEQVLMGYIGKDEKGVYTELDSNIIKFITEFTLQNTKANKSAVRSAFWSKLTAARCKARNRAKKNNI